MQVVDASGRRTWRMQAIEVGSRGKWLRQVKAGSSSSLGTRGQGVVCDAS